MIAARITSEYIGGGMKIYTKIGDQGQTRLGGGATVSKADLRTEAYGSLDELNAALGWAALTVDAALATELQRLQRELFAIGSVVANPKQCSEYGDGAN